MYPAALAALAFAGVACGPSAPPMTCQPWGTPEQLAERPSPYDSAMATVDSAQLKICYSRPSARGRVVFGELVPYDTLWRTGANEATVLHLSAPAEIAGLPVEEGDYSIYTVPSRAGWTLVVNASASQWGLTEDAVGPGGNRFSSAYTDEVRAQEVGRVPIEITQVPYTEMLTASFGAPSEGLIDLRVDWEETRVLIPIRFHPTAR